MSKYLKKFDTHTEYESYIGGEPLLPNVSICVDNEDKNHVHYNPLIPPPPPQPNDEIWYTTDDENMVELYEDAKCYGDEECTQELTILSHTYENGKGIIKFDGDIVSCGHVAEDEGLFEQCLNLLTCNLPDSCKIIGQYNFYNCSSLVSIKLGDSITNISESAFYYCFDLILTEPLGNSIINIGEGAFRSCDSLTSITCLATVPPTGGEDMFYSNNEYPIYVPSESVDAYKAAEYWSDYASRIQAIPSE